MCQSSSSKQKRKSTESSIEQIIIIHRSRKNNYNWTKELEGAIIITPCYDKNICIAQHKLLLAKLSQVQCACARLCFS